MEAARALTLYYAATILFLLLDYGLGIDVRLAREPREFAAVEESGTRVGICARTAAV